MEGWMDTLANWTVTHLAAYGVPLLLVVAFAGSLGIPFPITMVIIAAGAFAHEGLLDWRLAGLACLVGASLADHLEYFLGRWAGERLRLRLEKRAAWQRAQTVINRQGAWAILLTRFWFTPLAPAVNFIAGSRYPYLRFLLYDVAGQLLWVFIYGGLGYLFAEQWQRVSETVGSFTSLSMGVLLLAALLFILWPRRARE